MLAPLSRMCAVLFDLDGTLIDTHIDFGRMKCDVLAIVRAFGVDTAGLTELDILAIVDAGQDRLRASGRPEEAVDLRRAAFRRLREIEEVQCAHPDEVEGAEAVTAMLKRAGVPVGVVTRNCRPVAEALLARGRLHFDVLISRDDVRRTKPHPEHLLAALEALEVSPSATDRAAMVGDHWMDIRAGRAAGCATVGLLRGRHSDAFAQEPPDLIVDGVADLLPKTLADCRP